LEGGDEEEQGDDDGGWEVVDEDGSSCGEKTFLMWNAPMRELPPAAAAAAAGNKKPPKAKNAKKTDADAGVVDLDLCGDAPRGKAAVAARLQAAAAPTPAVPAAAAAAPAATAPAAAAPAGDSFTPVWKAREAARRAKGAGQALPEGGRAALGKGALGIYAGGGGGGGSHKAAPRSSPIVEVAALLAECVRHDLRCIAFCKTKKLCELVLRYCRDTLRDTVGLHKLTLVELTHILKAPGFFNP
jgi:hypothetical protein